MRPFRFAILLLAIAFLAQAVLAQSPSAVLKKAERAMGGKKKLLAPMGWSRAGNVRGTTSGQTGRFVAHSGRPGLYRSAYDLGGIEFERGHNGRSAWERSSGEGLRTLTGDASLLAQAEAEFRDSFWFNFKKQKVKVYSGGRAEAGGRPANVVRAAFPKGVELKLYFDQQTGLLIREEYRSGEILKTYDFADFRAVGGVTLPFSAVFAGPDEEVTVTLSEVRPLDTVSDAAFDLPRSSGEPLPEIVALLADLQANEDKVENLLDQYSYMQRSTKIDVSKDGRLRETGSETYQLSFYKGNRIRRLVEKNGKPLSAKEQAEADRDAEKQVEEIEKELAKKERRATSGPPDENSRRISIAEVLRASLLQNPRRERFRGRDVIVFDFEPNPNFDYKNAKSMLKFFGKTAGVMWIDEKDKQVARLDAYLADSYKMGGGLVAKLRKGASFTLEQERLNDEIWLPSYANINLSVRLFLIKGIDVRQEIRSFDYRKFSTEVKDAKVGEPERP
ncbi:MAG: hypothetical protein IPM25_08465 [Chloracidobacterium sp.]|nr:hypothetical protein [Chloracidobacterium sp.]